MSGIFFGVAGVAGILVIDELFWRLHVIRGELSRKVVHVLVGTYIAFWPFMMTMREIQYVSVAMLAVIVLSRQFHIFQSIHAVKRRTYGEYFFPISIGLCAMITDSPWIFAAAIMHLSLADGFAALVGVSFGDSTRYKVFGQTKSWVGTITFYVTSLFIVSMLMLYQIDDYNVWTIWVGASLPILATIAESVAAFGTDDLFVPLIVCGLLQLAQTAV